jgi:hypothetical protein
MRSDAITLDTNVWLHFFRTEIGEKNADGHITNLLTKVIAQRRSLCYDAKSRMANELSHQLDQLKTHREMGNFQNIYRGLTALPKEFVTVDHASNLKKCIDSCMPKAAEASDRVFVYVACASDTLLVSNDGGHITNHADCLKDCASRHSGATPEFWCSNTANANL